MCFSTPRSSYIWWALRVSDIDLRRPNKTQKHVHLCFYPKKEGSTGKEEQLPEEKYSDSGRKWCDFPFSSVEESLIYATIVLASLQPCSLSVHFLREHERESEGTCSIPVGLLSGVLCSSSFAAFTPKYAFSTFPSGSRRTGREK